MLEKELNLVNGTYTYQPRYAKLRENDNKLAGIEKALESNRNSIKTGRDKLEQMKKASHKVQLEMQSTVEKGSGLKERIENHESEIKKNHWRGHY